MTGKLGRVLLNGSIVEAIMLGGDVNQKCLLLAG